MKTPVKIIEATLVLIIACSCSVQAATLSSRFPGRGLPRGAHGHESLVAERLPIPSESPEDDAPARFVPQELVQWLLDDLRATVTGLEGNAIGIARFDSSALILRYDHHGGKHWPYVDIYAMKPITHLGEVFLHHDEQYEQDVVLGEMSLLQSDLSLINNMWLLTLDQQPGPVGHVYRILATAAFGVKTTVWNWWH